MKMRHLIKLVVVAMLCGCGSAFAINWDNGGVGDSWITPENWGGDLVPHATEERLERMRA